MKKQKNNGTLWIFGHHAVVAALQNPNREKLILKQTKEAILPKELTNCVNTQIVSRQEIDSLAGIGTVHQGLALQVKPLSMPRLDDILNKQPTKAVILILDQVILFVLYVYQSIFYNLVYLS